MLFSSSTELGDLYHYDVGIAMLVGGEVHGVPPAVLINYESVRWNLCLGELRIQFNTLEADMKIIGRMSGETRL